MTVDKLIDELTRYKNAGWGNTTVVIWDTLSSIDNPTFTTVENLYFKRWQDGMEKHFRVNGNETVLVLDR